MSSATLRVAVQSRTVGLARIGWRGLLPLLLPCGLLVAGAVVGYPFSLDAPVALERLLGLIATSLLALTVCAGLKRIDNVSPLLVSASVVALAGGLWVITVSGSDVFRGTVGAGLQRVFRPLFGLARLTDPVAVSNTRFIIGYNGLADLCLVAIFCCGGALFAVRGQRLRSGYAGGLLIVMTVSLIMLVGTGARGGLTGLAAGVCAIALFAWPRRFTLLALIAAPLALMVAAVGILDKGLEFSSTSGRLTYWGDLTRLLVEYPLTGVGLGVDTAYRVSVQYEINPDPERIFYAHNTFVQSYLEQGPLGALGMLAVPLVLVAAALIARGHGVEDSRRGLLVAGLGIVGGMEAHGLTDQVVTTNVGTGIVLLGLAAVLASLRPAALARLSSRVQRASLALLIALLLGLAVLLATPAGRAQTLLDLGGLKLNQALALDAQAPGRGAALTESATILSLALTQDSTQPAVLRLLSRARAGTFDDAGSLGALRQASSSPRLDAFDMLQLAHVYRDLGFAEEAYTWAARAYAAWGRPPEDTIMQVYAQSTLAVLDDFRARTLADQAEAAMRARRFGEARSLFQQALTFKPDSLYLVDRLGAAQRAVDKYGG